MPALSSAEGTELRTDDPQVTAAARELGVTMILRAWIEGTDIFIETPFGLRSAPAEGYGQTTTLPRGAGTPAHTQEPADASGEDLHPSGGSVPPQAPARDTGVGPEPPNEPVIASEAKRSPPSAGTDGERTKPAVSAFVGNCQADKPTEGGPSADDFTAIDGVGPVTAQKLHDQGLYTFDDLADWLPALADAGTITGAQHAKMKAWLTEHAASMPREDPPT